MRTQAQLPTGLRDLVRTKSYTRTIYDRNRRNTTNGANHAFKESAIGFRWRHKRIDVQWVCRAALRRTL